MDFYVSLFPDAEVTSISRYGAEGPGAGGSVQHATFTLAGQTFMCIDSAQQHAFGFTPAISLYVGCADEAEIDRVYTALQEKGEELMAAWFVAYEWLPAI